LTLHPAPIRVGATSHEWVEPVFRNTRWGIKNGVENKACTGITFRRCIPRPHDDSGSMVRKFRVRYSGAIDPGMKRGDRRERAVTLASIAEQLDTGAVTRVACGFAGKNERVQTEKVVKIPCSDPVPGGLPRKDGKGREPDAPGPFYTSTVLLLSGPAYPVEPGGCSRA